MWNLQYITKILVDFQIGMSVPLTGRETELKKTLNLEKHMPRETLKTQCMTSPSSASMDFGSKFSTP